MKSRYKVQVFSEDTINTIQLYSILYRDKHSFLLESAEGEEKIGRFSILGTDPLYMYTLKGKNYAVKDFRRKKTTRGKTEKPFEIPRKILRSFKVKGPRVPVPFCGGWVGFVGYETVTFLEPVQRAQEDLLGTADVSLILPRVLFVFDHFKRYVYFIEFFPGKNTLDKILKKRYNSVPLHPERVKERLPFSSNFKKEDFLQVVRKTKRLIREGEIIQAVLSQLFTVRSKLDPLVVYRALRILNPSPYMFFLKLNGQCLLGSSPEMLVKKNAGRVFTRPIAGTRPRGRDDNEDRKFERDLKASVKERAEHLMLVDLGRNDLGRVCVEGSVKVDDFMEVERYSHVMHLVSTVSGDASSGVDSFKVLEACFPAGTVSGAPKVRACQIISGLEPTQRGPYAGCVGYFDFHDNMDTCITIRSLFFKGGKYYIQAGAGLVFDSRPQKEYEETVNKAKAQFQALKTG